MAAKDDDFLGAGLTSDDPDFSVDYDETARGAGNAEAAAKNLASRTKFPSSQAVSQNQKASSSTENSLSPSIHSSEDDQVPPKYSAREQQLFNPYEGKISARQLTETVDEFLQRLSPLKPESASLKPWIFIANPYSKQKSQDLATLSKDGEALLEDFKLQRTKVEQENPSKAKGTAAGRLGAAKEKLKKDIVGLAVKTGVVTGKWMLFPTANHVLSVWRKVAFGTADNSLGIAAKVSTMPLDSSFLICIYTRDFNDATDVKRVVFKIKELGLLSDRPIYYKADPYTHIGIYSKNEFGLKASLFSSKDFLKA